MKRQIQIQKQIQIQIQKQIQIQIQIDYSNEGLPLTDSGQWTPPDTQCHKNKQIKRNISNKGYLCHIEKNPNSKYYIG